MYRKEQVDQLVTTLHAAAEELGAILLMGLQAQGGQQPQQQQFAPQQAPQQQFQPQQQTPQQFQQQPQQNMQQQAPQGGQQVTSDMILQLLQSPIGGPNTNTPKLVDDPNARPLLQQALQKFGIASLPEAKPEHYAGLYAEFSGILAHIGQQQGGGMQQAPQQQGFQPQQQQFAPQGQQGYQQAPQGYQQAPQQGYAPQQQQQGYAPQQGGGLV